MSESDVVLAVRMDPGGNAGIFVKRYKGQGTRHKEGPRIKLKEERKDKKIHVCKRR
jgi:hypothetical protein